MDELNLAVAAEGREDFESGVSSADGLELRIWLRLLTCCNMIDGEVRQGLHQGFATTLPRFDVLAQLERAGEPLTMGELSRRMMVTNGNITGLIDRLVQGKLVSRRPSPHDRRMQIVTLTARGRAGFKDMARAHRGWVEAMMAGLSADEMAALHGLLARLKGSIIGAAETIERDREGD